MSFDVIVAQESSPHQLFHPLYASYKPQHRNRSSSLEQITLRPSSSDGPDSASSDRDPVECDSLVGNGITTAAASRVAASETLFEAHFDSVAPPRRAAFIPQSSSSSASTHSTSSAKPPVVPVLQSNGARDTNVAVVSPATTISNQSPRRNTTNSSGSQGHDDSGCSMSVCRLIPSTAQEAMNFSHDASFFLQKGLLEESLEAYKKAADCYCVDLTVMDTAVVRSFASLPRTQQNRSILCAVNAAGCFRNMGAVCRLIHNYGEAVGHLQCAEELYTKALKQLGQLTAAAQPQQSMLNTAEEQLCLDLMILETMQSRASFHTEHLHDRRSASLCHVQCLRHVLQLATKWAVSSASGRDHDDEVVDGVVFTSLSTTKQTELGATSLLALCEIYRSGQSAALQSLAESALNGPIPSSLAFLLDQHKERIVSDSAMVQILRSVSDLYFAYNEWDGAQSVLLNAMEIEVTQAMQNRRPSPHDRATSEYEILPSLEAMDAMGLAHERTEQYDRALTCYESALLARSRYYYSDGATNTAPSTTTAAPQNSIAVAQSLIRVARVMELQGNTEGGLDLYRAAHAMYALQIVASDQIFDCPSDAQYILQLIPNLLQQERFEEARAYLTKCLAIADNGDETAAATTDPAGAEVDNPIMDKSQIYFDLGRAYIGLRDYVSATICLVEAAKEEGRISEDLVLVQLQKIDVLQREESRSSGASSTQSSYMAIRPSRSLDVADGKVNKGHRSRSSNRVKAATSSFLASNENNAMSLPLRNYLALSSSRNGDNPAAVRSLHATQNHDDLQLESHSEQSLYPSLQQNSGSSKGRRHLSLDGMTMPTLVSDMTMNPNFRGEMFEPNSHEARTNLIWDEDGAPIHTASEDYSSSTLGAPRLIPDHMYLSDDVTDIEPSPLSSDSNGAPVVSSKGSYRGRGRRLGGSGMATARKGKDEKIAVVTSQQQQPPLPRPLIAKVWRPRARQGFQSLPVEKKPPGQSNEKVTTEEDVTADDSTITGPIAILHVSEPMMDDDISDITMRLDDPNASRDTSHEWWWGVTSEGFGRWFPASYVSQAVQAADAFLSANAIHSKSKAKLDVDVANTPNVESETESVDEGEESCSEARGEYASNVGIKSRASRVQVAMLSLTNPLLSDKPSHAPNHNTLFNSPSPLHYGGGNDVTPEIASCREMLMQRQKDYGRTHAQVATCLFTLAILYSRDRDVDAAIECATEALRIQTANKDLEDATQSLHFMADLHLHQKQFKQALAYYTKALTLETSNLGYFCNETAKTLNCMGTVQSLQNNYRTAMESHEEALRVLKECHGGDLQHPLVSETLCHIGIVYHRERNAVVAPALGYTTFLENGMLEVIGRAHEDRGCYKMAIAFFDEKLQRLESQDECREILEDSATTLNGLGMLSSRAGLLVEAIDYYERALSIQLQLGCDEVHLSTARVLTGAVQFQLGNWQQALKLFQDALPCLQHELGIHHETVAATHYQIGVVQTALCDYDAAMNALNEAIDIQRELLGDAHPATLRTQREIGNMYAIYTAELDVALGHFETVLANQKRAHGERHPNIAETLHSMGCAYAKRSEYSEALLVLEECYYMRVEFLGWDHPLQASTLHDIAKVHLKRGRVDKASNICDMVLNIRRNLLSERHVDVARALTTKGRCWLAAGSSDQATSYFEDALAMTKECLGERHPLVAEIYAEWGALYLHKCQFDAARTSVQKALEIYSLFKLDDDYYGIQDAKEKLNRVERDEMLCV